MLANGIFEEGTIDFVRDIVSKDAGLDIRQISMTEDTAVRDIDLEENEKIIAVNLEGGNTLYYDDKTVIKKGDYAIVLLDETGQETFQQGG